jgi:NAD(P)-dependent dehydrogenase (short-subunit alcohol dehydrogenase family)
MSATKRIAVVSGANRGIGLEIARQLAREGVHVVMGARKEAEGKAAARALAAEGLDVEARPLDVASDESVRALAAAVGPVDIVVNNAGIALDGFNAEVARSTLDVNFFGALRLTDALLPALRDGGRVVMVSSGLGELSGFPPALRERFADPDLSRQGLVALMREFVDSVAAGKHAAAGWPSSAYRVSKAGINALTRVLAREIDPARRILVNAACPGWVRTAMGGPGADRTVEEGADTPVWLALLPEGGPQGGVFRDRKPAPV